MPHCAGHGEISEQIMFRTKRDKQRHLGPHLVQCNKLPEIKIVAVVRAHICFVCAEMTSPMEVREHTVPALQSCLPKSGRVMRQSRIQPCLNRCWSLRSDTVHLQEETQQWGLSPDSLCRDKWKLDSLLLKRISLRVMSEWARCSSWLCHISNSFLMTESQIRQSLTVAREFENSRWLPWLRGRWTGALIAASIQ